MGRKRCRGNCGNCLNCAARESRENEQQSGMFGAVTSTIQSAGATAGIVGAVASSGFAGDAVSGDVADAKGIGEGWKNSAQTEQRNSQTRGHRQDTTYKGRQRGGSSKRG